MNNLPDYNDPSVTKPTGTCCQGKTSVPWSPDGNIITRDYITNIWSGQISNGVSQVFLDTSSSGEKTVSVQANYKWVCTPENNKKTQTSGPSVPDAQNTVMKVDHLEIYTNSTTRLPDAPTNYVSWASNGMVIAKAIVDPPNTPTNRFPSAWSFVGGSYSNIVTRFIPQSVPGFTTFIATAGKSAATNTVGIVKVESVKWFDTSGHEITEVNPNPGGGLRIFPDKPSPTGSAQKKVKVRATVSPKVKGLNVFFQAYDVDDPSANAAPVDDESKAADNREAFTQIPMTAVKTDENGVAEVDFTVTMQPGDNFRVVAASDQNFFTGLIARQNDGDKARVVDGANQPVSANQVTDLLTVWRRLHVERDSMASVDALNIVFSQVLGISGTLATGATSADLNTNLRTGLNDLSPNLDSTPRDNGRFENGRFRVGTGNPSVLLGNGNTFVKTPTPGGSLDIPFTISKKGAPTASGQIIRLFNGDTFAVSVNLPANKFNGGTIIVAGQTFTVLSNTARRVVITSTASIPSVLIDDDPSLLLPVLPDTTELANALAEAYVLPVYDVGDNSTSVTPKLNVNSGEIVAAQDWTSSGLNADDFWVAYILNAFQSGTHVSSVNAYTDADPNSEWAGTAFGITSIAKGGSLIYRAIHREPPVANPVTEEQDTVVHEVGHDVSSLGVEPVTGGPSRYTPTYLDGIRKAKKPTGR